MIIKEGDKASDEEKKFQLDGVKEVVRYCQNDIACRRVQVLRYFGQTFDPIDCHNNCNNCADSRPTQTVDLTDAGIDMIRLVQSFGNSNVTKAQTLDAFRGSSAKALRDKGLDEDSNPLSGRGKSLSRDHCDHLIDHLLLEDALEERCISSAAGWNNMYIGVGARNAGEGVLLISG
jgi:superfamily II DNA helicase RecQ